MNCLIVEDDPTLTYALCEAVRHMGHSVQAAGTVADAQRSLATNKFDLIIFDFVLPDGTTLDVSSYAAMTQPNCRIILLTGRQIFLAGEHKKIAPGIDWILRKPVSLKDLSALIEYAARDLEWNPTPACALP